jgi:hypothetical protein
MDGAMLFLMRSLVAYHHGMLAERDRLRKQEERKVSLVFGLKKGKVNILHPQPRHPRASLSGEDAGGRMQRERVALSENCKEVE